ncbi:MAG: DNA polymerase III subunit delta [Myxococcales bacterium]|nr:DNA polymerase III subunit delta [Myxococcales bacterium]
MSDELEDALNDLDAGNESPVYLLVGEEFLVRKAAERLLSKLVPGGAADLNCVTLDAAAPREIAAELATFPMFGGRKVVLLRDPEFLAPKKGRADALGRAREAWKANRKKEAARRVLSIAARAGWGVADLDPSASGSPKPDDWERELGVVLAEVDTQFLKDVKAFCVAENVSAPSSDDTVLNDWLSKKPATGQVLVIAATELETKSAFVKLVKSNATLLEFKVASKLKDLDLTEFVDETLAPHKKKLGPGALDSLKDRVGANFRLLASELEKLALHTDKPTITVKDIELLVGHAREEEWLELSDAVQKRSLEAANKYLEDSLAQGAAPLAILGAVSGIVRNLTLSYERMAQLSGGKPPRNYNDFQARLWPKIEAEAKAAKTKVPHPYAAFMGMQSAVQWGRQDLLRALVACAEADLALKLGGSKGNEGNLVLERLFWTLCGKAAAWESQMHVIRREQER